jgi:hypothetical protein
LFFEKCTIGLGVLDAYLTPAEKQGILKVERCDHGIGVFGARKGNAMRDSIGVVRISPVMAGTE